MKIEINHQEKLSINYEVLGEGPDIFLIHGLGLSSMKTWRFQIEGLSRKFRVHAIDLRGFGKTNNPEKKFSVQQHVYDIKMLMDVIGLKCAAFAGFSMGGWIAQQFALDYPDKVQALVLSCTTSGLRPHTAAKFVERASSVEKYGMKPLTDALIANTFNTETIKNNPELILFYKENFLDSAENSPESYAAMFRALSTPNITPQLHRITCPTLVLCGEKDNSLTRGDSPTDAAEIIHKGIKNSELTVIPEGGHYVHLEQPDQWNKIVDDFLTKVFFHP